MSPAYRVYCPWCGQTYISSATQSCSLCGATGRMLDPDSPEALADLKDKMQADPSVAWPKTRREWILSIVHTALMAPLLAIYMLITAGSLVAAGIMLYLSNADGLAMRLAGGPCILFVIAILTAKLILLGYIYWRVWLSVIREDAEEKRMREREQRRS